jgi:adenylate kinase
LAESSNRHLIIVGISGVGKTTVISRAAELLKDNGYNPSVLVFGTLMFEEAKKIGVKNRDEMRKLSIINQRRLQEMAANRIAEMKSVNSIMIIDTHLFINTNEGYYPGIPERLLNIIKPTHMVLIAADPDEVVNRRRSDGTRNRDIASIDDVQSELDISKAMIVTCSVLTGSPFMIIMNNHNKMEDAASTIANMLSDKGRKN